MQFDVDMNSDLSELFLEIRELIMNTIDGDVKEKFSENITSYFSNEGGYCYLRTKDDYVHIGWFRGVYIDDKYGCLYGNGKTIRGQKIKELGDKEIEAIKYYIQETLFFLLEHNELMKIKNSKKAK